MEKLLVERPLVLIHLSATFSMGEPFRPASKFTGPLSEDNTSATLIADVFDDNDPKIKTFPTSVV